MLHSRHVQAHARVLRLHLSNALCRQINYTHGPTVQGERKTLPVNTNRYLRVSSQTTRAKGLLYHVHRSPHPGRLRPLGWRPMRFRLTG